MAVVGKGDPRWIVQDREDGANVNAWHWTERDVSESAKQKLHSMLQNQTVVSTPTCKISTKELSSYEGECTVYNRKGKVTFVLEIGFSLGWEGDVLDASTGASLFSGKGKLTVHEIDHDCVPEKLQVDVSINEDKKCEQLLDIMRVEGRKFVRAKVAEFLAELIEGHGILTKTPQIVQNSPQNKTAKEEKTVSTSDLTQFSQTIEWRAPIASIWEALTDEGRIGAYTRSATKINVVKDGEFSFLNGSISGTFTLVENKKRLEMNWRLQDWTKDHFSKAIIQFDCEEAGTTLMKLEHSNIPTADLERTKQGWKQNFWEPIKMLFGYGFVWK